MSPSSRSRAIERRAVVRATSKVSTISDSVGMREPCGYSPDSIRARMMAAICRYGGTGPVGSILVTATTLADQPQHPMYRYESRRECCWYGYGGAEERPPRRGALAPARQGA